MFRPAPRVLGPWIALGILLALALVSLPGRCRRRPPGEEARPGPASAAATDATRPPTVFGEYAASSVVVVDGDTWRLPDGVRVRIRGLDTEEVFRRSEERAEAERDFEAYAQRRRGDSRDPVKYATPAGEAATQFARSLLASAERVRLEIDDPDVATEDAFGRQLLHGVLLGPEGERHFAEALIQAGHSPYFVKYGRCRRYDARLAAAEKRARAAGRGIWGEGGPAHYPDYPERRAWWQARAAQVERWRAGGETPARIALDQKDAAERLTARVGESATVFGLVRARKEDGRPRILWLRHRRGADFPIVVFSEDVWSALDHAAIDRGFVTITGRVSLYRGEPQIVVDDPAQISTD